jgi:multisubunit Na+/H+ antiporter MnhF subunit
MGYLALTMIGTLVVAMLICQYRFVQKKRISWGTLAASTLIGNLITVVSVLFYEEGWGVFTREAWIEPKGGWGLVLIILGFFAAFSVLPALAVAVYYQRRTNRAQSPAI